MGVDLGCDVSCVLFREHEGSVSQNITVNKALVSDLQSSGLRVGN